MTDFSLRRVAVSPRRQFVSLWIPVIIWCGLIFWLSSIPKLRFFHVDWLDFVFRKAGHMGIYGILARLLARALIGSTYWPWKKIFAWSLALAILYAGTDEWHQRFVPGRLGQPPDIGFDAIGAWLALGLRP